MAGAFQALRGGKFCPGNRIDHEQRKPAHDLGGVLAATMQYLRPLIGQELGAGS
jgi:hypothetical protein